MTEKLQLIKPKTLSEDKLAFIQGRWCALDFMTSIIVLEDAFDINMPSSFIPMKNLFQDEMDKATATSEKPISKYIDTIKDLDYKIIPLNLYDVSVFNSLASAGEDIFWSGLIELRNNGIVIKASGFNYFIEHKMAKVLSFIQPEQDVSFIIDYQACYFVYQMFKAVTKTKPKNLLIHRSENIAVLTNEEKSFYILLEQENHKLKYKNNTMLRIEKFISDINFDSKGKIDRKESGFFKDSLFKHLTKCLNDTLDEFESPNIELYKNELTKVYIFKKRT